jgi:hypothetical protein
MSRLASLGLLIALALGAPSIASAQPEREVPAQVTASPAAPAPAATPDSSQYAQREKQDQQVASYEGGSVIVIGASGTVLLVLLILLLVI